MTVDVDQFEIRDSLLLCTELAAHSLKIGGGNKIDEEFLDYLFLQHVLDDFDCETEVLYRLAILGRCGIDVKLTALLGETPISIAIYRSFFRAAFMLVAMGVDLDFVCDEGHTVVLQTIRKAIEDPDDVHARSFLRLVMNESNASTKNRPSSESGLTPLGIAALSLDVDLVSLLLKSGCDVNVLDTRGRSPLEELSTLRDASEQRELVAKLLLSHGGKRLRG